MVKSISFSFVVNFLAGSLKKGSLGLFGLPQWGHEGACSDILLPHSGHFIKAISLSPGKVRVTDGER